MVPAISDWWLAQAQSSVPFACFVSHTVLGTILIIFVDCPSPLLLSTYIGGWPCSVAPFKTCLALGPHLPPSKL